MSRKIRIGNDIDITWSLLDKEEQPETVTPDFVTIVSNLHTKQGPPVCS